MVARLSSFSVLWYHLSFLFLNTETASTFDTMLLFIFSISRLIFFLHIFLYICFHFPLKFLFYLLRQFFSVCAIVLIKPYIIMIPNTPAVYGPRNAATNGIIIKNNPKPLGVKPNTLSNCTIGLSSSVCILFTFYNNIHLFCTMFQKICNIFQPVLIGTCIIV